jgi:hypothetical protein
MHFDDVEMRRMDVDQLKPKAVIRWPLLSDPVQVAATIPMGNVVKMLGKGRKRGQSCDNILTPVQLSIFEASPELTPSVH